MPKACGFCGSDADPKACAGCGVAWYCSAEHQKASWKGHKEACKRSQLRRAWADGLNPAKQREWLVDCYRMRVDDLYVWGGGNLMGLYNPDRTADSVARDFLVFCKLAAQQCVLPRRGWEWPAFLSTAASLLQYAFEKSDAQDKYGAENVFSGAFGGRSLRFTGEAVYGSSVMGGPRSREHQEVECAVYDLTREQLWGHSEHLRDVGGKEIWQDLVAKLGNVLGDKAGDGGEDGDEDAWPDDEDD